MVEEALQQDEHVLEDVETEQHVTFEVGDEAFAISMSPLKEIVRLSNIISVPLSPPALEGLINLRGQVLPVVNLRRVFGFEDQDYSEANRVLIIKSDQHLVGFLVDRVTKVIAVKPDNIEAGHSIETSVDSDFLQGIIKDTEGFDMLMLLDFDKVLQTEMSAMLTKAKEHLESESKAVKLEESEAQEVETEQQLVSFGLEEQEYAIPIENVKEIVQVPEHIIHIPKAPEHVLGVVNLREQLLPLISLRQLFRLSETQALDEHHRIVVVAFDVDGETLRVGVVTDSVKEVLRVLQSDIEDVPLLLQRDANMQEISAICRIDEGQRLVSILSVEKMFSSEIVQDAVKTAEMAKEELPMAETVAEETNTAEEQLVVFRIQDEEYGVPIASVKEIVRVPEQLTHVPKAPEFIEGIINLRGSVLPVIDERRRLGLPHMEGNDRQRIMVFKIDEMRTGFIVDSVVEVLRVPESVIKMLPGLTEEDGDLIPRVANLEEQDRMIMLLNPEQLLETHEVHALTEVMND